MSVSEEASSSTAAAATLSSGDNDGGIGEGGVGTSAREGSAVPELFHGNLPSHPCPDEGARRASSVSARSAVSDSGGGGNSRGGETCARDGSAVPEIFLGNLPSHPCPDERARRASSVSARSAESGNDGWRVGGGKARGEMGWGKNGLTTGFDEGDNDDNHNGAVASSAARRSFYARNSGDAGGTGGNSHPRSGTGDGGGGGSISSPRAARRNNSVASAASSASADSRRVDDWSGFKRNPSGRGRPVNRWSRESESLGGSSGNGGGKVGSMAATAAAAAAAAASISGWEEEEEEKEEVKEETKEETKEEGEVTAVAAVTDWVALKGNRRGRGQGRSRPSKWADAVAGAAAAGGGGADPSRRHSDGTTAAENKNRAEEHDQDCAQSQSGQYRPRKAASDGGEYGDEYRGGDGGDDDDDDDDNNNNNNDDGGEEEHDAVSELNLMRPGAYEVSGPGGESSVGINVDIDIGVDIDVGVGIGSGGVVGGGVGGDRMRLGQETSMASVPTLEEDAFVVDAVVDVSVIGAYCTGPFDEVVVPLHVAPEDPETSLPLPSSTQPQPRGVKWIWRERRGCAMGIIVVVCALLAVAVAIPVSRMKSGGGGDPTAVRTASASPPPSTIPVPTAGPTASPAPTAEPTVSSAPTVSAVPTPSPTSVPTSAPVSAKFAEGRLREVICSTLPPSCSSIGEEETTVAATPQRSALDWTVSDPSFREREGWRLVQRYALAVVYFAAGGTVDGDGADGDWLASGEENECLWGGVQCDGSGRIIYLSKVPRTRSVGEAPRDLVLLRDKLEILDMTFIGFRGTIPTEYGTFSEMKTMRFDGNKFVGTIPPELGRLTKIETLSFNRNSLTGTMPEEICNLKKGNLWYVDADCFEVTCKCCTGCEYT